MLHFAGVGCTMKRTWCPVAATASRRRTRHRATARSPTTRTHAALPAPQMLSRHFGMLPTNILQDAVLCIGRMTLQWRGLGQGAGQASSAATQSSNAASAPAASSSSARASRAARVRAEEAADVGYAGDMSSAASSPDEFECSVRAILPMLARVTMPTPQQGRFGLDELIARGGVPLEQG